MRIFYISSAIVILIVTTHSLPSLIGDKTQCDLNIWLGNQSIRWCSDGPPNITIPAINYTGGCNTLASAGEGGIRLWIDLNKGRVQEMVGFSVDNCSINDPVFFLAEPLLKLGHCGVVCMFVMLYPIASIRVNCSTTI